MLIKKSTAINGVQYITKQIAQDMKETRLITYSWSRLLNSGIKNVFEFIYRKKVNENEFHGLFYYPESSFLFRCVNGTCKVFLTDFRKEESTYLKCLIVTLTENGQNQLFLPSGVLWGILGVEDNVIVQIHTEKELNSDELFIVNPLDEKLDFKWDDVEFLIPNSYDSITRIKIED